jgi:hypothetical protein
MQEAAKKIHQNPWASRPPRNAPSSPPQKMPRVPSNKDEIFSKMKSGLELGTRSLELVTEIELVSKVLKKAPVAGNAILQTLTSPRKRPRQGACDARLQTPLKTSLASPVFPTEEIGPGIVTGYTIPAGLLQTNDKTGVTSICGKYKLLWFSLLHQLLLLAIGVAGWLLCNSRIWIPATTYMVIGIGLWITHWAGHQRWIFHAWFVHHTVGHHVKSYPPAKYLSERYVTHTERKAGTMQASQGTGLDLSLGTLIYLPWPAINAVAHILLFHATAAEVVLTVVVACAVGIEQEVIHRQVHITDSVFEQYHWFQTMRALHFLHHKGGMHHNYAMVDFLLDIMSGNLINTV